MQTRSRWWAVFASLMGLLGSGSITVFVFSVFLGPLAASFGWSRGALSAALLIGNLAGAVTSPIAGAIVDRLGIRVIVLPGIIAYAALTAAFALLNGSLPAYFALSFLLGIAGAMQSPMPYSKLISALFDRRRGIALAIAITGTGIGAAVMPQLAATLIAHYGWRIAFLGLGLAIFIVAFPATALLLPKGAARSVEPASGEREPGVAFWAALRTRQFWQLAVAVLFIVGAANGVVSHAVTVLTDMNVPPGVAVMALSAAGIVTILSRLITGFALDRFQNSLVAATCVALSAVGIMLVVGAGTVAAAMAGIALCGIAIGAEMDIIGFLVSRYFGLFAFGKLYGLLFAIVPIGVGVGTAAMGASFDRAHSYAPVLTAFAIALVVAAGLLLTLGPYAYPVRRDVQPVGGAPAGAAV